MSPVHHRFRRCSTILISYVVLCLNFGLYQFSEIFEPDFGFEPVPLFDVEEQPPPPPPPLPPQEQQQQQHILGPPIRQERQDSLGFGSCIVVLSRDCPHKDVTYHLYTRSHPERPEAIRIGAEVGASNITASRFNRSHPTKIIIHGYNSDMYISALVEVKNQYLLRGDYNVFAIDWSPIAQGPCYPAAVWNARFAGRCASLLVQRLRELPVDDIHVIGFSLGAHVSAFMANHLQPYRVPRITGLDPAMPGFATVDNVAKLDASDAQFVDVIHTNAFMQGKVEQCGHVDFYCNGGAVQPGCWSDNNHPMNPGFFACNHHRAPYYFAESINTPVGFYGWPCASYLAYIFGRCPPPGALTALMGEYVARTLRGMQLVLTDAAPPFAVGRFQPPTLYRQHEAQRVDDFERYKSELGYCDRNEIDEALAQPVYYELEASGFL